MSKDFKYKTSFRISLQIVKTRLTQAEFNNAIDFLNNLGVHFNASINDFERDDEYDQNVTVISKKYDDMLK